MLSSTTGADAVGSSEPGTEAHQRPESACQGFAAVLQVVHEHLQGK